jgi:hypothetical protein
VGKALSKSGLDKLRQRNCFRMPQNPTRRLHALLGGGFVRLVYFAAVLILLILTKLVFQFQKQTRQTLP